MRSGTIAILTSTKRPRSLTGQLQTRRLTPNGNETSVKQELVHFDIATKAIQKAASVAEVKTIRDKAEALRIYARQSGQSLEMQNKCAEIKLRAERRAGEMLASMQKNIGA